MRVQVRKPKLGAGGFSLVELLIVITVLSLAIGSVAMVGRASERAYSTGTTAALLEEHTAAAMHRITAELEIAMLGSVTPDPTALGTEEILYTQPAGLGGATVIPTPLRRLAFDYEVGEIDDGIDNNGNGLIDEGRVVLWEDFGGSGERQRVLTRWVTELLPGEDPNGLDDNGNGLVDECGFTVVRMGETFVVWLSLQRRDGQGHSLTRSARSAMRLRN